MAVGVTAGAGADFAGCTGVAVATGGGVGAAVSIAVPAVVGFGAAIAERPGATDVGAAAIGGATALDVPSALLSTVLAGGGDATAAGVFADTGLAAIISGTGVTSDLSVGAGGVVQLATMAPAPKAARTS